MITTKCELHQCKDCGEMFKNYLDFLTIKAAANRNSMSEREASDLIEEIRNNLPMNQNK